MRILLLTFYYSPDLSAGSFRATALTKALLEQLPEGSQVDVVTTLPNRYSSFSSKAPMLETECALDIRRIELPNHNSGMFDQSRAFVRYAWEVMRFARSRRYDVVFATSSRLMTATLAAWIAKKQGAKLYLDIRDIFVDTIKDVLPRGVASLASLLLSLVEHWTFVRANKVNLVSRGFESYFAVRYPHLEYSYFTNGVDDEFIEDDYGAQVDTPNSRHLTVLYAGNIGDGQGLHVILPALAQRMHGQIVFKVIGDGGKKLALQEALRRLGVDNVELLPPMSRQHLIRAYRDSDVLFLHLNDYEAFRKVLPSKLFEYAALGKPIWAGVAGYAADFVRSEITNAAVFAPCDAAEAEVAFSQLSLESAPRAGFIKKFARVRLMRDMARDIVSCVSSRRALTDRIDSQSTIK